MSEPKAVVTMISIWLASRIGRSQRGIPSLSRTSENSNGGT
jgi:hypothetical protein